VVVGVAHLATSVPYSSHGEEVVAAPTYLLVHGAWHGSWCWERFAGVLDQRGVAWKAIDLPSSANADPAVDMMADVREVHRVATDLGPLVIVAHSYAGAVVTEAAPQIADLRGILYLAALIPRLGQSASDVTREYGLRSPLDEAIRRDDGMLRLELEPAALALYGDCDEETRGWAITKISSQTLASFRTARTSENSAVASTYVICQRDEALLPEVQERIAQCCDEVVAIDSDHSPFLSHPHELADLVASMNFHG
jgi:pimeloyl-ACP methyl ester carboxylesterase